MAATVPRSPRRRRRLLAAAASGGLHALALWAVAGLSPPPPPGPAEFAPMSLALVPLPPPPVFAPPAEKPAPTPEPEPAPAAKARAEPEESPPPRVPVRAARVPPPADVAPLIAEPSLAQGDANAEVGESELAGAGTAGSAGRGGQCNMTRRLQDALRDDRQVRAAVAEAYRGRALRVWDGDWVRHRGQEGAGLATVREAIMWEVGFAPEACRRERMRGLVLISLSDAPGAGRLVVGADDWRWSDLLFSRDRRPNG